MSLPEAKRLSLSKRAPEALSEDLMIWLVAIPAL